MDSVSDWFSALGRAASDALADAASQLPSLMGAILILIAGWLFARVARGTARRISNGANRLLDRMFQRGALFTSLTVAQNVELPIRENFEVPDALLAELADLRIRMVGLGADAGAKYPAQLSGGMTKRAALARALALDPAILFLDEPTSGLDPISAEAFDGLVLDLQRGLGLTVVMITHDLDTIYRVCNRVGVIVDGRMIAGTLEEIVKNDHPWIRDYFHGERSRAPQSEARSDG